MTPDIRALGQRLKLMKHNVGLAAKNLAVEVDAAERYAVQTYGEASGSLANFKKDIDDVRGFVDEVKNAINGSDEEVKVGNLSDISDGTVHVLPRSSDVQAGKKGWA